MPQVTYPEQISKYKILKELFHKYFEKEYVEENVYTIDDKLKLEFYKKMIKSEDYHEISADIHERSSFYGKYHIYTKNKLTKTMINDLRENAFNGHEETKIL
jgi:hypothetical protein